MHEVRRGRVRIPGFQRPLRWEATDARQLLDSLYRGYPVGTLLLWETRAEAGDMTIGELRISADARSDALWVVDGQQRIISLARILLPSAPDKDTFALYFDLDEERFLAPPSVKTREANPGRWLPMTAALNSEHLMQWLFTHAANDERRRQAAFRLGRRIREYEVPAYLVKTESEDVLREIFGRANTTGKRLKESEVFDALHGGRGSHRPASMADIAADLTDLGFGRIEETILHSLQKVLLGVDVAEKIPLHDIAPDKATSSYANTAQAARQVVQFLKTHVGIPRYEFLPYKKPFVALGKFFHHFPEPGSRNLDLLARWVWRGALSGAHRGDAVSTRHTLAGIRAGNEDASVQSLLGSIPFTADTNPSTDAPFNFRFAASKLLFLALLDLKPRHLITGEPLDWSALDDNPGDTFSPADIFTAGSVPLANSLANRIAHPPLPGGVRRALLASHDAVVLASLGIDEQGRQALATGDEATFVLRRAHSLGDFTEHFFASRARWHDSDRPPLRALLLADPDDTP